MPAITKWVLIEMKLETLELTKEERMQCCELRPQPAWRRHAVSQGQQIANLLVGVDVRGKPSMAAAQDEWRRHLSGGLELAVIGRERSDGLQPARCRNGARSCDMLARPIQLQIERQRPLMVSGVGESGEAH